MPIFKISLFLIPILVSSLSLASSWEEHQSKIEDLERNIYKYQQEMDVLVEKKKNTRERARIEQTLQRIVEIHAELISLRKDMDNVRDHLKAEHPDKAHILDNFDSRMYRVNKNKRRNSGSPLGRQLDQLLLKVQLKFSSFLRPDEQNQEMEKMEKVVEKKRKVKREREADVYLRRRSKIKLSK